MVNILFVDDNAQSGLMAKIYLEKKGFHVFVAKDTTKARSFLSQKQIDCIITDVGMPGESGIDFYKWLKSQEEYKDIPVLIVSAHAFSLDDLDFDSSKNFFEKPIFFPKLIDRINEVLGLCN